jgi:broad-specificity NMP kinase
VDEIDTTGKTAPEVAEIVTRVIKDELELPPGQVDWLIDFFWPEN